jgi:YfiH family protein
MWKLLTDDSPPLWHWSSPPDHHVLAFTTRRGGVSVPPFDTLNLGRSTPDAAAAVSENRLRVLARLGLDAARVVTAGQVHGADVVRVESLGHVPGCDALVTRVPGLALAVSTADCMALLLAADGAVAAAHSGWRGTAAGMPVAALRAVCEMAGTGPGQVTIHLGPCIRGCCYEVGPDVARLFPAAALTRPGGTWHLDLPTAARLQLADAGALDAHDTGACTACEPAWYYSHRRDRGACGRHWGIAARADARTGARV